ncbi:NADPH:quinone oxidoreductase family protein [Micromonospora sp. NPDC047740]|uniref:NADPH:quinone oxidoreductase family protein n=1 Tax=Micromonospora sp. NPDC047740 TaxID=3364254 RepID=UPI0037198796
MTRRLVADRTGEPAEVLSVVDLPDDPPPGPGEVQLAVRTVGLNFLDVSLCRGEYPVRPTPPMTPGVEAAGRVVAAGVGAEHLLGQEVIACPTLPRGALGDAVTVDAAVVVPRPATVDPTIAAALPVTYQTAWFALERAGVAAGQTVLVHAGAGGVGIAVTQLAVARGARVIATAGGARKTAVCRAEGAAAAFDYTTGDFVAAVREATDGRGADVIIDPVGGDVLARSLDCLAFEGAVVTVGAAGGPPAPVDPGRLIAANATLIGLSWGSQYPWQRATAVRAAYQALFDLYGSGAIRPRVSRVVPLNDVPAALSELADRRTIGKIVARVEEGEGQ